MKPSFFRHIASIVLIAATIFTNPAHAQKLSFVYLQSDDQQPFYVQMDGRNISSSASGYVILPKLADGVLQLKVGYPNSNEVQDYTIKVEGNDQGFLIKNFGEKGWGLFNLQSMAVQMSGSEAAKKAQELAALKAQQEKRAADSLLAIQEAAAALRKADSIKAAVNTRKIEQDQEDSILAAQTAAAALQQKQDEAKRAAERELAEKRAKDSLKIAEAKEVLRRMTDTANLAMATPASSEQEIIKMLETEPDTIVVKMPPTSKTVKTTEEKTPANAPVKESPPVEQKTSPRVSDKRFLDIEISPDTTIVPPVAKPVVDTSKPAEKPQPPLIEKVEVEKSETKTVGLVANNGNTKIIGVDTVSAPLEKTDTLQPENIPVPVVENEKPKKVVGLVSNNPNTKIVTVPVVEDTVAVAKQAVTQTAQTEANVSVADTTLKEASLSVASANLNCKEIATEKDFYNLRKTMVMSEGADEMVFVAKKAFKEKCYTTTQMRNLCVLLLSDSDRYSFLDAAYPYATDQNNFASLADLLKDSYFLNRFKAMLK